jgi:enoyl-CoA hydratase/carnithine racemase
MSYKTIQFAREDAVATITLNRPRAMNSLSWDLVAELGEALAICEGNGGIRAKWGRPLYIYI